MSLAYACHVCSGPRRWYLLRRGDAVVAWSCDDHLVEVCRELQRDWEVTEIVVRVSIDEFDE